MNDCRFLIRDHGAQKETGKSTHIIEDVNFSLSVIDRTSTQTITEDIKEQNTTNNQLDLTDIYGTLCSTNILCFQGHREHSPTWAIS